MRRLSGGPERTGATRVENAKDAFGGRDPSAADPMIGLAMSGKNGRYTIRQFLDAGGMGKIYVAEDDEGKSVAVKVISPNFIRKSSDETEKIIERFFREARAAAIIDHPNVIKLIDIGTFREDVFCAMEYLRGVNLDDVSKKQRLSWGWLAPIMMEVCDGVQAAHRHLIHRDLSPDNIFLAEVDGRRMVKVLDFGLAKFTQGEDDGLTKTGFAMGKITFMSPEQAEKAMGKRTDYDHRVDIYAMGVIMYKLLTGVAPFKGETDYETLFMRLNAKPMRPRDINPDIPPAAEKVIMKAMARHEGERYQSAAELKAAIAATLPGAAASGTKPESDDMFMGAILESMEHAEASAQKPLPLLLPEEEKASMQTYMPGARKRRSVFGTIMKWGVILAIAAGGAYLVNRYKTEITQYFHEVKSRATSTTPSARPGASDAPSAAPLTEGYMATMDSTPAGATVFELKNGRREYIGVTPLVWRFGEGEHSLVFAKRGYLQKRATVSGAQPVARVTLSRPGRTQPPQQPSGPEQMESVQPEGAGVEETPVE